MKTDNITLGGNGVPEHLHGAECFCPGSALHGDAGLRQGPQEAVTVSHDRNFGASCAAQLT